MRTEGLLLQDELFVILEDGRDSKFGSVRSWTPSFPSVWGGKLPLSSTDGIDVLNIRKKDRKLYRPTALPSLQDLVSITARPKFTKHNLADGSTEGLSLQSLCKGIEAHLQWRRSENPALTGIRVKQYTEAEKQSFMDKWEQDCEDPSLIRSTYVRFS